MRTSAILAALLLPSIACNGSPTAPSAAALASLSATTESANYLFRHTPGVAVDTERQERFHDWILPQLGVTLPGRITYYRYRDRRQMQELTGRETNGFADPERLAAHSIHPWCAHEAIHVLTFPIGRPTDFWNEGIAVAYAVSPADNSFEALWQNRSIHAVAREFLNAQRVPPVDTIVDTDAFRRIDEPRGYPVAGSFVRYLGDRNGFSRILDLFRGASRNDSRTAVLSRFNAVYGRTLQDADSEWRAWLQSQ